MLMDSAFTSYLFISFMFLAIEFLLETNQVVLHLFFFFLLLVNVYQPNYELCVVTCWWILRLILT